MNKLQKRFLITVLALTLVLSGTMTAFGAESGSINVQYNGNNISFAGATVKIVDGEAMLPVKQTAEAIGAEITSESDFISARDLAEQLDCCVGWDAAERTVVIFDPSTLLATADEDFSVIKMLSKTNLDMEKAYATTGTFDMDITAYDTPNSLLSGMGYSIAGKISGIQQKSSSDLVMNLSVDFEKMLAGMPEDQRALVAPFLEMFQNIEMKVKTNGETGDTYMSSGLFSSLSGETDGETWIKMNAYDSYEKMGIDMKSIAAMSYSKVDFSDMLESALLEVDNIDAGTYQEIKTTYAFLNDLFGNKAFETRTTGAVTTHILAIDQATILDSVQELAHNEGQLQDSVDMADIGESLKEMDLAVYLVMKEKAGFMTEYTLKGSFKSEEGQGTYDLSGDPKNVEYNLTIDQKDVMKIKMDVTTRITESSELPDLTIPEDATVIEYPMY